MNQLYVLEIIDACLSHPNIYDANLDSDHNELVVTVEGDNGDLADWVISVSQAARDYAELI